MKLTLTKAEKASLHRNINRVLDTGKMWESKTLHHPTGAIINAVLEIKGMKLAEDNFTTNGWEWDWWQQFQFAGNRYTLSGSGYYGGHAFFPAET